MTFFKTIFGLTVTIGVMFSPTYAFAGKCGEISCKDITGVQSKEVFQNLFRDLGSDCRQIQNIKVLDVSQPGNMMLYKVMCHDGLELAEYQLVHFMWEKKLQINKLSSSWADPIIVKY